MTKVEQKLMRWINKHLVLLFFIIVNLLALLIRMAGKDFVSLDASRFLLPWFDQIKAAGGFSALNSQVGDYNILYQFLITALTYLPIDKLVLYKGLSIVFDYILAICAAFFTCEILKEKKVNLHIVFVMVYAAVLFLPTVIMNSSVWGQCDAMYTSFVVLSLLFLLKERYTFAFVFLGFAFSFKLQAIFILPFFLYYYFSEKKYSLLYFYIMTIAFYLPCIPGFIYGRSLLDPISIYLNQSGRYPYMSLNFPSIWVLVGYDYETLSKIAILLTIFVLGIGLFIILSQSISLSKPQVFLKVAVWSIWTCLVFLPAMHERYGFLLEILLLVLLFVDKRYFFSIAIVEITSIITYGYYLYQNPINLQMLSIIYVTAYILFSFMIALEKQKWCVEEN